MTTTEAAMPTWTETLGRYSRRVREGERYPRGLSWVFARRGRAFFFRVRLLAATWAWDFDVSSHAVSFTTRRIDRASGPVTVSCRFVRWQGW